MGRTAESYAAEFSRLQVNAVSFNHNGSTASFGGADGNIRLYDVETQWLRLNDLKPQTGKAGSDRLGIVDISWCHSRPELLASLHKNRSLLVWDTRDKSKITFTLSESGGNNISLMWHPRSADLAVIGTQGAMLLDTLNHTKTVHPKYRQATDLPLIGDATWGFNGKSLLLGNDLVEFETDKRDEHGSFPSELVPTVHKLHHNRIMTLSASDNMVVTACADSSICLWDMRQRACFGCITDFLMPAVKVKHSNDGELFAVCSELAAPVIVHQESMTAVGVLPAENGVVGLAWHPSKRALLFVPGDKTKNVKYVVCRDS